MIKIRQYGQKWRVELQEEEWEVKDIYELKELFENILELKIKYGNLK